MKYSEVDMELKAVQTVASLMIAAAKTAPKERGINSLEILLIDGDEKDSLAKEMRLLGEKTNQEYFLRDANNVDEAICVVLLGATGKYHGVPNCGYCGFENCGSAKKAGALCAYNSGDLGIALGSAVSVASIHKIDNRIMFSAGKAALSLRYFSEDVCIAYGIPLSVSAKNPFYDRKLVSEH